jgi:hypothetical protein
MATTTKSAEAWIEITTIPLFHTISRIIHAMQQAINPHMKFPVVAKMKVKTNIPTIYSTPACFITTSLSKF